MSRRPARWRRLAPVFVMSSVAVAACTGTGDVASTTATSSTVVESDGGPTTSAEGTSGDTDAPADTDTTVETDTAPAPTRLAGDYTVEVISSRPHDPTAYTQGLELHDGRLLESTGQYGESERRWVDPQTGEVLERVEIDSDYFGEGITLVDGAVYQLTWQENRVLIADEEGLGELGVDSYEGEGWGLCAFDDEFVMSNGTAQLTIRSVPDFDVVRTVEVLDANGTPVALLNELECVGDQVLANIWGLDVIVAIDPTTGTVDAVIDAAALRPANAPADDLDFAFNGIAYDPMSGNYFVTGKLWDTLYEVAFVSS